MITLITGNLYCKEEGCPEITLGVQSRLPGQPVIWEKRVSCTYMKHFCISHKLSSLRKTRDLFKKIREIKGTFHAEKGTIKDRNGMNLREAEDIKKRWQEYTEELYKKIFITQIITMVWSLT